MIEQPHVILAVPGGPELLVIAPMAILGLIGYLIYRDATRRNMAHPLLWGLGTVAGLLFYLVPGLILLGCYVYSRPSSHATQDEASGDASLDKQTDPYLQDEIEENISRE
jgi:hypothetical protein